MESQSRVLKTRALCRLAGEQKIALPHDKFEDLITLCWRDLVNFYADALRFKLDNFHCFRVINDFLQNLAIRETDKPMYVFEHFVEPVMSKLARRGKIQYLEQAKGVLNAYCEVMEKNAVKVAKKSTKLADECA